MSSFKTRLWGRLGQLGFIWVQFLLLAWGTGRCWWGGGNGLWEGAWVGLVLLGVALELGSGGQWWSLQLAWSCGTCLP